MYTRFKMRIYIISIEDIKCHSLGLKQVVDWSLFKYCNPVLTCSRLLHKSEHPISQIQFLCIYNKYKQYNWKVYSILEYIYIHKYEWTFINMTDCLGKSMASHTSYGSVSTWKYVTIHFTKIKCVYSSKLPRSPLVSNYTHTHTTHMKHFCNVLCGLFYLYELMYI